MFFSILNISYDKIWFLLSSVFPNCKSNKMFSWSTLTFANFHCINFVFEVTCKSCKLGYLADYPTFDNWTFNDKFIFRILKQSLLINIEHTIVLTTKICVWRDVLECKLKIWETSGCIYEEMHQTWYFNKILVFYSIKCSQSNPQTINLIDKRSILQFNVSNCI